MAEAEDKGVSLPPLASVQVVEEKIRTRHHHILVLRSADDAPQMLGGTVRRKLQWRVSVFERRPGNRSAADELLSAGQTKLSTDKPPKPALGSSGATGRPATTTDARRGKTSTYATQGGSGAKPLDRLASVLERLISEDGINRLTAVVDRLLGGTPSPSSSPSAPAPALKAAPPTGTRTRPLCYEYRDRGRCSRNKCAFRHGPDPHVDKDAEAEAAPPAPPDMRMRVEVDNPPRSHPQTRGPHAEAWGQQPSWDYSQEWYSRPWCISVLNNQVCPYFPTCRYRHPAFGAGAGGRSASPPGRQ